MARLRLAQKRLLNQEPFSLVDQEAEGHPLAVIQQLV
jgi:hypothetical protein